MEFFSWISEVPPGFGRCQGEQIQNGRLHGQQHYPQHQHNMEALFTSLRNKPSAV
jgi:hypothetical protein